MDREELKGYILEKMAGSYDLYNMNMANSDGRTRYDAETTKGQAKHKQIQTADAYMDSQYGYQKKPKATEADIASVKSERAFNKLKADNPLGAVGANNRTNNSLSGVKGTKTTPFIQIPNAPKSTTGPSVENAAKIKKRPRLAGPLEDDLKLDIDFGNSNKPSSKVKTVDKNSKLGQVYNNKYRYPEVGRTNSLDQRAKNIQRAKGKTNSLKDINPLSITNRNNSLDKVKGTKVTPFIKTPEATTSKIGPLKENATKKTVNDKATIDNIKDSIKDGASTVKNTVKDGASSAASAVKKGGGKFLAGAKKGGKLALIGTGIGLGVAGGKALLGNKQQPQDDQRLATFIVNEDGIEKQAIAFSGVKRGDIPKTKRKDKKAAKRFYKSLPKSKKREFLNEAYKEKAKIYNRYDQSKDSIGNFVATSIPSLAGTAAAVKGHPRAATVLNAGMIPGIAGSIASGSKNDRADAYSKQKVMNKMLGIKDKKANIVDNDMEKQAIAFSGKKLSDIPKTSRKDAKEIRKYYRSLSPEEKHKFDVGSDIGSLKYYDAYDRRRDAKGNAITSATIIGAPLGLPGMVASSMKENKAVSRAQYDQMQKMKKRQKKEASEVLDSLYKEASSVQGVSGLANATNAVSPFAKATLKDASSTPLPSLDINTDTSITPPPKPPKTDATEVKNDISSSTTKEANEVINSFEKVLEKTASEFLNLTPEELQPKDSEYMANKRLYVDLFNSPNINW